MLKKQAAALGWAKRRRLRVAARGHGVICKRTKTVLVVDFVFEEILRRRKHRKTFLASVYFSPRRCARSKENKYAVCYMRAVQRVCNQVRGTLLYIGYHGVVDLI